MLKKSVLASLACLGLTPLNATQNHMTHVPAPVCPPCAQAGVTGWVLIPAGPMTGGTCTPNLHSLQEREASHPSSPANLLTSQPDKQEMPEKAPARTPEEKLLSKLKRTKAQFFLRANSSSDDPAAKTPEWGKALGKKVYFKESGRWIYDPKVNSQTDLAPNNFKDKQKVFQSLESKKQPTPVSNAQPANEEKAASQPDTAAVEPSSQEPSQSLIKAGKKVLHRNVASQTDTAAAEPSSQEPSQSLIKAGKKTLHRNKDGVQKWTRLITTGNKKQWYIFENNLWILWDEQIKTPDAVKPPLPPVANVRPSLTQRNVQVGPGTYNSKVPGAPGTPEASLNPVNR